MMLTRRTPAKGLGAGWLLSSSPRLLLATAARDARRKDAPNIVLAMTDDQGWGDTGYNGHPVLKTPHLDEMASRGLRFDRFYAGSPVCSPTRGSCLTGRHPFRYGLDWALGAGQKVREPRLRKEERTVAQSVPTTNPKHAPGTHA